MFDAHVHLVGNGAAGSGCRIWMRGSARLMAGMMLRGVGLEPSLLGGDLDNAYAERLVCLAEASALDGVLVFAQDMPFDASGAAREDWATFVVPNDWMFSVCRRSAKLLPVASVHPFRPGALEELRRCAALGAVALKLLPNCHAADGRDPRHCPFWEELARLGLPLIAHTGGENLVAEPRPDLRDPRALAPVLDAGVTVIAAHCGSSSRFVDPDHVGAFLGMLERHPRLHGDISALGLPNRIRCVRRLRAPGVAARLVHGSDVPVPVFAWPGWLAGLYSFRQYRRLRRIANPLERDLRVKQAMGFPEEVFTRVAGLLPGRAA